MEFLPAFSLSGKRVLIMGVANERSIAWGIARAAKAAGADLGFTYIDAVERRMRPLAEELEATLISRCDVASDQDILSLADVVREKWDSKVDVLVHSLAYAEREDLEKDFVATSRKGFHTALDISAFSLIAVSNALAFALESTKGSVITLSYFGAERVVPNYNVMGVAKAALESSVRYLASDLGAKGIRVNAISAGPIRTLAASGVKDFRSILTKIEEHAPLRRNVTTEEVGNVGLFLAAEASRGITGQVIYVDSGYSIMAM